MFKIPYPPGPPYGNPATGVRNPSWVDDAALLEPLKEGLEVGGVWEFDDGGNEADVCDVAVEVLDHVGWRVTIGEAGSNVEWGSAGWGPRSNDGTPCNWFQALGEPLLTL